VIQAPADVPKPPIHAPRRQPTCHHGDVVHGVTRLERGTRYGLYALLARDA